MLLQSLRFGVIHALAFGCYGQRPGNFVVIGPGGGGAIFNPTISPHDANTVLVSCDMTGSYITHDGGQSWRMFNLRGPVKVFAFDPKDPQVIYAETRVLWRSQDGGRTWRLLYPKASSAKGIQMNSDHAEETLVAEPNLLGSITALAIDPDNSRTKMWRNVSSRNYKGGVCRSADGGKTWAKSNSGMQATAATHILLDPRSSREARTLYVAAFGRGVYKSTDDGKTWSLKNNGIRQKEPFAWRLAQASDRALYVLVARRSDNGSIGNDGDGAIYRSTDGAEHWNAVAMPKGANAPNGLAVDPKSPDRLYLAAWARATEMHGEGGGIYLSNDAGGTWRHVLNRDQHVYDVTVDPRDPKLLFASGFESSAWRSTDRGEHWRRIAGFNFKWGHRVIPDPLEKHSVYVTTFGGSVWHRSATEAAGYSDANR